MKKLAALLLALCMILSLAACGEKTPTSATPAPTPATPAPAESKPAPSDALDATYTAENPLILKLTWGGAEGDYRGQAYKMFADNVAERTNSAIQCEFYPNNGLGAAADVVEMVSKGANIIPTFSADFVCDYGCPDMMLCNIFYTFDSVEKTLQFSNSDIFKEMCDKVAEGGIRVLNLAWIEAPRQLMTTKPVQKFSDLKGMKIRIPSFVYGDFWAACGGVPSAIGLNDAYSSLSSGILDATETYLEMLYDYSIQEVCPYCTLTYHTTAPGCFMLSEDIWQSMSPEMQKIVSEEAYAAGAWFSDQQMAGHEAAKEKLEAAGVTFYELSDDDMVKMKEIAIKQANSYVDKYNLTPGLYDEIVRFLAD